MADRAPVPKIRHEDAIVERMDRFSGALGSALRARGRRDIDPAMREIDETLRQSCLLERLYYSKLVMKSGAAPRVLIERLLTDNFLVARSLVEAGYGVEDDRLIELLKARGHEFQLDVAGRTGISERICDFLIVAGGPDVTYRVVINQQALISNTTIAWLMQKAESDRRLAGALSLRFDGKSGARQEPDTASATTEPQSAAAPTNKPVAAPTDSGPYDGPTRSGRRAPTPAKRAAGPKAPKIVKY